MVVVVRAALGMGVGVQARLLRDRQEALAQRSSSSGTAGSVRISKLSVPSLLLEHRDAACVECVRCVVRARGVVGTWLRFPNGKLGMRCDGTVSFSFTSLVGDMKYVSCQTLVLWLCLLVEFVVWLGLLLFVAMETASVLSCINSPAFPPPVSVVASLTRHPRQTAEQQDVSLDVIIGDRDMLAVAIAVPDSTASLRECWPSPDWDTTRAPYADEVRACVHACVQPFVRTWCRCVCVTVCGLHTLGNTFRRVLH